MTPSPNCRPLSARPLPSAKRRPLTAAPQRLPASPRPSSPAGGAGARGRSPPPPRPPVAGKRGAPAPGAGAPRRVGARGGAAPPPLAELRPLGQARDLFLIAEGAGRLWILDQHVAHERI